MQKRSDYREGAKAFAVALAKSGLSQGELERRIGVTKGASTRWMQAVSRPSVHFALQLERLLGLDPAIWETSKEKKKEAAPAPPMTEAEKTKRAAEKAKKAAA